jgi:hypothetical protein
MDFATGKEKLVYEAPHVDLSATFISFQTKKPMFAVAFPDYQKLHFFDPQAEEDARIFLDQHPLALDLNSADYDERLFTVTTYTDKRSEYYLFNLQPGHASKNITPSQSDFQVPGFVGDGKTNLLQEP